MVPRTLPPLRRVGHVRAAGGGRPRGDRGEALRRPRRGNVASSSGISARSRSAPRTSTGCAPGSRRCWAWSTPRDWRRPTARSRSPRGRRSWATEAAQRADRARDRGSPLGGPVDAGLPGSARRTPAGRAAAARGDRATGALRRPPRLGRRQAELVDGDAVAAHRGRHAAAARRAAGADRAAARGAGAARGQRRRQPALRAGVRPDARGPGSDRRRVVDRPAGDDPRPDRGAARRAHVRAALASCRTQPSWATRSGRARSRRCTGGGHRPVARRASPPRADPPNVVANHDR